jgi:hypothetical protein
VDFAQYVVSRNEFICFWTSIMYNHPMHLNSNKHPLVSMIWNTLSFVYRNYF